MMYPLERSAVLALSLAAFALGACSSTILVEECADNEASCAGECVDLGSDPDHCGACETVCAEGTCVAGQCQREQCSADETACPDGCFDTTEDPHHCGSCNMDCGGLYCQAGKCVGACDPGFALCGQSCVDTSSDPDHCGGCDATCDGPCIGGQCQGCPPGTSSCFGQCVDTTSDPFNCGGCNIVCGDGFCSNSQCVGDPCPPGTTNCFGECVDTGFDPDNCGGCGVVCQPFQACEDHACVGDPTCSDNVCGVCDYDFIPSDPNFQVTGSTAFAGNNLVPDCTHADFPEVLHIFTPTFGGPYSIDTVGSSYDTVLQLMDEQCNVLACSDDVIGLDAQIETSLEAGKTYYIVLDGFDSGSYAINVHSGMTCPPGLVLCQDGCVDTLTDPFNCGGCEQPCGPTSFCDQGMCVNTCVGPCGSCQSPVELGSQVPISFQGNTGFGDDLLIPSCGFADSSPEVLHAFTAPATGTYVFSTAGSSFDTVLSLINADSCGEVACDDDGGPGNTSSITRTLAQGQTVYVMVDGALGQSGAYTLSISLGATATCPTLVLPSTVPQVVSGSTVGGANQFTPGCVTSQSPEQTLQFTAPTTKTYTLDTFGSNYDTTLYVLGGTCSGSQLACDDDIPGSVQSQLSVALTAGQTVTIVVDGFGQMSAGSYQLHIQ